MVEEGSDIPMDLTREFPILAFLALSVSGLSAQEKPQAPETPARPEEPAGPQSPERAHNNIRRAIEWKRLEYSCDGGVKVSVALSGVTARVRYLDRTYLMKETESREGTRFSDGKLVWCSRDNGAFLQDESPAGSGKMLAQNCREQKSVQAGTGIITGTVTYRERMALPPDAVVQLQLQDVSEPSGGKLLAEEKIEPAQQQVPIPFELNFDPSRIDPKRKYQLSARIIVGENALFAGEKLLPALTRGHPEHVDLVLKRVQPQ